MNPDKPDFTSGEEHEVWIDRSTDRVWKVLRRPNYGKSRSIRKYLVRLEAQNIVWGDSIRIEGVLPDGRMVTSQPFIEGRHPETPQELATYLEAAGWEQNRSRGTVWQTANGRIIMEDVHRHNFIIDGEGELRAIDTNLVTKDEFLQYEDDEWVEPEDKMSDLLDQGVLEQLFTTPETENEVTPESEPEAQEAEDTPEPEAQEYSFGLTNGTKARFRQTEDRSEITLTGSVTNVSSDLRDALKDRTPSDPGPSADREPSK